MLILDVVKENIFVVHVLVFPFAIVMQENRVHALKKEVDYSVKMAELIEYNLEDVDAAIIAVRVALANGMNWEDLARMVKEERKSGNPVAGLIDKLRLERNCITLLLSNNLDEMDDDEKTAPVEKVLVEVQGHHTVCVYTACYKLLLVKYFCVDITMFLHCIKDYIKSSA